MTIAAAALAASCATANAKPAPDTPALEVPPPPARIVEPVDTETPQPVPLVEEPAHRPPPRQRQTPPATRPETPKPEPPKPTDAQPPAQQAPAEPAKPSEDAPKPPPTTLQTTPPGAEGEVERGIRALLARATNDLNRIDYRLLNADARTQYDTAKGFVRQSGDALKAKNLVFAKSLADKAAALAAQLAGSK